MNTDFRVACDWPDHPKTLALIARCGDHGALCLVRLWAWAAQHRPEGRLDGLSDLALEAKVGWTGPPGELIAALTQDATASATASRKRGFLTRDRAGVLVLHDWSEHNGYASASAKRTLAARLAAKAKWSQRDELVRAHMRSLDAPSPAPVPAPVPVPSLSREGRKRIATESTAQPAGGDPPRPLSSTDPKQAKQKRPNPDRPPADYSDPNGPSAPAGSLERRGQLFAICCREGLGEAAAREESFRRFLAEQATASRKTPREPEETVDQPAQDDFGEVPA